MSLTFSVPLQNYLIPAVWHINVVFISDHPHFLTFRNSGVLDSTMRVSTALLFIMAAVAPVLAMPAPQK